MENLYCLSTNPGQLSNETTAKILQVHTSTVFSCNVGIQTAFTCNQGTSVVYSIRALGHKSNCSRSFLSDRSCISSRGGAGRTSPFRYVASHFLSTWGHVPSHLGHAWKILKICPARQDIKGNSTSFSSRQVNSAAHRLSQASWLQSKHDSLNQRGLAESITTTLTGQLSQLIANCTLVMETLAWNLSTCMDALVQHQTLGAFIAPRSKTWSSVPRPCWVLRHPPVAKNKKHCSDSKTVRLWGVLLCLHVSLIPALTWLTLIVLQMLWHMGVCGCLNDSIVPGSESPYPHSHWQHGRLK